ncbi:MAG: oxidoreductase [Sphingomonas bacterium]|nr:oxidoreductase [Sphingomonas bacterium]
MLMSLGMFAFSIPTLAHDELQRRTDWRHGRSPRVGARDATQFTGPGDDTISLTGTAFAELGDVTAALEELRTMGASGQAWSLVDGAGRVYGAFVITALDERQKVFMGDGTPLRIDFALDLLAVDGPEPTT